MVKFLKVIALCAVMCFAGCGGGGANLDTNITIDETLMFTDKNITLNLKQHGGQGTMGIDFGLRNNTEETMTLIWSEVVIRDAKGNNSTVIHGNLRRMDVHQPLQSATIPKGTALRTFLAPKANADDPKSLLPSGNRKSVQPEDKGKTIKLTFPLDIGGERVSYDFTIPVEVIFTK